MFAAAGVRLIRFPISRDPPEGGTYVEGNSLDGWVGSFPISRDPPEGGTAKLNPTQSGELGFQFLGIPPKGEPVKRVLANLI